MASQSESDKESGTRKDQSKAGQDESSDTRGAQLATEVVRPEPFAADDPYYSERFNALSRETGTFLQDLGFAGSELSGHTERELRSLQSDVRERQRWPEATQNGFRSIVRLGHKPPPRAQRVL